MALPRGVMLDGLWHDLRSGLRILTNASLGASRSRIVRVIRCRAGQAGATTILK